MKNPLSRHGNPFLSLLLIFSMVLAIQVTPILAQEDEEKEFRFPAGYTVSSEVLKAYESIFSNDSVKKALDFIRSDHQNTLKDQKEVVAVAAPPFKEAVRAKYYMNRLMEVGLKDVQMDKEGNVFGTWPGSGRGPKLWVGAHLDTVFPAGTDLTVKEKDGKIYAPGISDNARGLALVLSIIRALKATGIKPVGDIIFTGNVGEEGLGDLRGVKAIFRDHKDIAGWLGTGHSGVNITRHFTGSHRYKITYKGPGGHSWSAFGQPSAVHAAGRAISKIDDIITPKNPKTTFTVGTVNGGKSVNSIADEAILYIDMRSTDKNEMLNVEKKILDSLRAGAAETNKRWGSDKITVDIQLVGDRPAGTQAQDSPSVQAGYMALKVLGQEPKYTGASSSDANWPIGLGIPAINVGGGGIGKLGHSTAEWFDPTDAYIGTQVTLLSILGMVGIDGVSQPLLTPAGK